MQLYVIETGRFKLDGGAMFGVVPKPIWQRTNPADGDNRIDMAMRCLLVQEGDRLVLIDNGIGEQHDAKFRQIYVLENEGWLDAGLAKHGFSRADVTDLVLTHLHFDHCGGTAVYNTATERYEPNFLNARIWLQRRHLAWATQPNAREKASFLRQNIEPVAASGQLQLLDGDMELFPGFALRTVNGHTEAQQLPVITLKDRTLFYAADLFPTFGHIPLPYVMGYDTRPLLTLEERQHFLPWLAGEEVVIFYEHDPLNECGTVRLTEKGGFVSDRTFPLSEIL
ncbi:MAG: MBL fold metallo-hydrolase [Bacteroidetes bacterium]|nr:MBL fold metallo-hydrolase [Bacteroidota bacterium]